jgi:ferric-dicitrate binding protein FerR (iron transport regulator)
MNDIDRQAAYWLIELESSKKIEDLWPAFEAWLNERPAHLAAFLRLETAWRALDDLRDLLRADGMPEPPWYERLLPRVWKWVRTASRRWPRRPAGTRD